MSGCIQFLLDDETHVVDLSGRHGAMGPDTTVLQYLREQLLRRGTKEGCAEGDCGACTVVVVEPVAASPGDGKCAGRLRYRPVNACIQLLAGLDGRELLTVESLARRRGPLHPVQQAMVEHHASQCGFCTPGIVMSLFSLYKAQTGTPVRRDIDDCLAGNLCRCTGYRPILEAGLAMHALGDALPAAAQTRLARAGGTEQDGVVADRLTALDASSQSSIAGDGTWLGLPRTLAEALQMRAARPDATVVAGGTDVGLQITKSLTDLAAVLSVARVSELKRLEPTSDVWHVGAAVPIADLQLAIAGEWPALDELLRRFASPPIRHAATLGGNIANGSPIGDSMPALLALDATVELASVSGTRTVALADFYTGYRQSVLRPDELIVSVLIPRATHGERLAIYKLTKRPDQDISAVCGAFWVRLEQAKIVSARVAYGGMAATPARVPTCERALEGVSVFDAVPGPARDTIATSFTPLSDQRASARYRALTAANLLDRLFMELRGEPRVDLYRHAR
ncbi:MAG: xanthine dehydrogenase small subunit [Pseudomonadota bacterium]